MVSTIALRGQHLENGGMRFPSFGFMPVVVLGNLKARDRKCCKMFAIGIGIAMDRQN